MEIFEGVNQDKYEFLSCIETHGANYFNTEIPVCDISKMESQIMFTETYSHNFAYGAWGFFSLAVWSNSQLSYACGTGRNVTTPLSLNTIHTFIHNAKSIILDGVQVGTGGGTTSERPLFLFAASEGSSSANQPYKWSSRGYARIKFYYARIYDKHNNLIRQYVPARRLSDDKIGIYDVVNKQFHKLSYDNTDSDVTIPSDGSIYRIVEYLDLVSGQYINTGVKPTHRVYSEVKFRASSLSNCEKATSGNTSSSKGTVVYGAGDNHYTSAYELYSWVGPNNKPSWQFNIGNYGYQYIGELDDSSWDDKVDTVVRYDNKQTTITIGDKTETLSLMSLPSKRKRIDNDNDYLYIGSLHRDDGLYVNSSRLRIYYFDMWRYEKEQEDECPINTEWEEGPEINLMLRHMLPCTKITGDSNENGMFDFANMEFYPIIQQVSTSLKSIIPLASLQNNKYICNYTTDSWVNSYNAIKLKGSFEISWRVPHINDNIFMGIMKKDILRRIEADDTSLIDLTNPTYFKYFSAIYQYGDGGGTMHWHVPDNTSLPAATRGQGDTFINDDSNVFRLTRKGKSITYYVNNVEIGDANGAHKDITLEDDECYFVFMTNRPKVNKMVIEDLVIKNNIDCTNSYTLPSTTKYPNIPVEYIKFNGNGYFQLQHGDEYGLIKGDLDDAVQAIITPDLTKIASNNNQAVLGGRAAINTANNTNYELFFNTGRNGKYRLDWFSGDASKVQDNKHPTSQIYLRRNYAKINNDTPITKTPGQSYTMKGKDGYTYRQLEYIQSTQRGTFIDTGIHLHSGTKWQIEFSLDEPPNSNEWNQQIAGLWEHPNIVSQITVYTGFSDYPGSPIVSLQHGIGDIVENCTRHSKNTTHKYRATAKNQETQLYNEKEDTTSYGVQPNITNTSSTTFLIGSRNGVSGTQGCYAKFYSVKFYQASTGVLTKDFVPAKRSSDNAVGLFEKISGQFYTTTGNAFNAGPLKAPEFAACFGVGTLFQPPSSGATIPYSAPYDSKFCGYIGPIAAYLSGKNYYWIPVKRETSTPGVYGYYYYNVSHFKNGDQQFGSTEEIQPVGSFSGCGNDMPMYNYEQLEYVELFGGHDYGHYFETDYAPTQYCKVKCTVEFFGDDNTNEYRPVFGRRTKDYNIDDGRFGAWYNPGTKRFAFNFGIPDVESLVTFPGGKQVLTVETDLNNAARGICQVGLNSMDSTGANGAIREATIGGTPFNPNNNTTSFYIGSVNDSHSTETRTSRMKLYEFVIYEAKTKFYDSDRYIPVRKYTPVRNLLTGQIGLYEWYTGKFITAKRTNNNIDIDVRPGPSIYPAARWN